MAKNKKPRKPYKPRAIRNSGCSYPRETIDEIKDIINGMGLTAEVALPQGAIDEKQCVKLQDLLHWGGMLMFDRKWKGQEAEVKEFKDRHYKALHAWAAVVRRKNSGQTHGYVAKADELQIIREVCAEIVVLLKEAVELAPQRTVRELLAAIQIVDEQRNRDGSRGVKEISPTARAVLNQRTYRRPGYDNIQETQTTD